MSEELWFVTVGVGIYFAWIVVLTLLARWSRLVREFFAAVAGGGGDDRAEVAIGIVVWPVSLVVAAAFGMAAVPVLCVMYFVPEEGE